MLTVTSPFVPLEVNTPLDTVPKESSESVHVIPSVGSSAGDPADSLSALCWLLSGREEIWRRLRRQRHSPYRQFRSVSDPGSGGSEHRQLLHAAERPEQDRADKYLMFLNGKTLKS